VNILKQGKKMKKYRLIVLLVFLSFIFVARTASSETVKGKKVPGGEDKINLITEALKGRFGTLSIHGNAIIWYQWINSGTIGGVKYKDENNAGVSPEFYLEWEPIEGGEFLVRLRYVQNGNDSQGFYSNALYSTVDENFTLAHNKEFRVQKALYRQNFLEDRLYISVGKNYPESFIDLNKYANDQRSQFVGQPFVDNPFLDNESSYGPTLAVGGFPLEDLELAFVLQSITWEALPEEEQKSAWEDLFKNPFYGAQLTYSPKINGRGGNYRLYGWNFSYDCPRLDGEGTGQRWGIGISIDQEVRERAGIFARGGYQNKKVYEAPWFVSGGVSLEGLIPSRQDDTFGFGAAGLFSNRLTGNSGTEVHFEAYYRVAFSKFLALTPDLQYVLNPRGDSDNDKVIAATLRGEFLF